MKKYLYVFNYPPEQEHLCQLEFKYLFHQLWVSKYYITETDISIDQSAFIKAKIDILAMSTNLKELIAELYTLKLDYLDFKVIYFKNEITHVDYKESLLWCKDISWAIEGSVNMSKPKHTFALTKVEDMFIFGYYHHGVPSWKAQDNKPYTFSNSLDIKLARTLVNIACENKPNVRIVDPCCGVGTVVLEGLALKQDIEGFDISREISFQARKNLEYYEYDKYLVNKVSIHDLDKYYDVAIIDMPYNLYTPITYEEQCAIITSARKICGRLILVAHEDMTKEINRAGFLIIDTCILKKSNYCKFQRIIYVCI
ncbi:MAG: TRM11 family SAM-dependent methyltransferase [Coprobacillaceae bacterium]